MNQLGQVVGYARDEAGPRREAVLWNPAGSGGSASNPHVRILANFKGEPASAWYGSEAFGINNVGQAVGWANGSGRLVDNWQAALWQNGEIFPIGSLMPYGAGMARAINDDGIAVGAAVVESGGAVGENTHAFLYDASVHRMIDLGVDYSRANSVNARGEIAGSYYNAQGERRALYFDTGRRAWDLHSAVTLGGATSEAAMINNKGQVVGWTADRDGVDHGFFYDVNTKVVKHIAFAEESRIFSINNEGLAVGQYQWAHLVNHALRWNVITGATHDLNSLLCTDERLSETGYPRQASRWSLLEASSINDAGQITGVATRFIDHEWRPRAYLLTPVLA
jgi:probable HAF family extracellular repeat protein